MTEPGDVYTHGHQDAVLRSHRWRTVENSAAYLRPYLRSGNTVLDVGCGPGTLAVDLAARVLPGRVVGVDVAHEVVAEARAYARERGAENVSFEVGDFRDLGTSPASFDVVHAHQLLQHLRDPVGALREMGRLARPGGHVAVRESDYSGMVWHPADPRLDAWLATYLEVTRHNGAEARAGRFLLAWAHEAGYEEVMYTTSTWTFATPTDRAWWGSLWADRTTTSTLAEQAVKYEIASRDQLADMAAGWRAWAADPSAVFVVLHGELVAPI